MKLKMPTDVLCPLCRDEQTRLKENKAGKPYFECHTFDSVVNLRPDDGDPERSEAILTELSESDSATGLEMDREDIQALRNATDEAKLVRWSDAPTATAVMAVWHGGPVNVYSVYSGGVQAIDSLQGQIDTRSEAEDRIETYFEKELGDLQEPEKLHESEPEGTGGKPKTLADVFSDGNND